MVKVRLAQVDGKYPNLALMKLAAHYLAEGAQVDFLNPLADAADPPDLLLVSKTFDFTPDLTWWPDCAVERGGTGYLGRFDDELLPHIEAQYPAYDLFGCEWAMGFTSRGCPNRCGFCVVPQKEGKPRVVADLDDFWRGQQMVRILDPNITALPEHFEALLVRLASLKVTVDFNQGLDARLLTADQARLLKKVRLEHRIVHLAWDLPRNEDAVRRSIRYLTDAGFGPQDVVVYILVGYNTTPEEDVFRVQAVRDLGATPWVMPYQRKGTTVAWTRYMTAMQRWGSRPVYRDVAWDEYARGPWDTRRDFHLVAGQQPQRN